MSSASPPQGRDKNDKSKRGYRACLHCRSRKAKCDLGDIDAPSEPPCSRCKRESRECVFAPSRRGGNNTKRKLKEESTPPSSGHDLALPRGSSSTMRYDNTAPFGGMGMDMDMGTGMDMGLGIMDSNGHGRGHGQPQVSHRGSTSQHQQRDPNPVQNFQDQGRKQSQSQAQSQHVHAQQAPNSINPQHRVSNPYPLPQFPPDHKPDNTRQSFSIQNLLQPSPNNNTQSSSAATTANNYFGIPTSSTHFSPADQSTPSQPSHTPHGSSIPSMQPAGQSTPSPKRRRLHLHPPVPAGDPSSIVVADMQNESDALHILALASQHGERHNHDDDRGGGRAPQTRDPSDHPNKGKGKEDAAADLGDFALIKLGIASKEQVIRLTDIYFKCHHHLLPMVPSFMVPRTPDQLASFAQNERYLLTTMVIIASRHDTSKAMRQVHDQSWAVMRGWLADIHCLGAPPTVGLVESLLLLAENLPRDPVRAVQSRPEQDDTRAIGFGEEFHSAENRQAWMLIGTAIRSAYGLGIDKLAYMLLPDVERTQEHERARLAFTYCYIFDRHVSLRLGKAFWSRGPNICFQGFSSSAQTGPAAAPGNFPYLREVKPGEGDYPQDDFASLIQAYIELTQMMSSAHDTLYPNAARTRSLVVYGEYFKYLDELARSLDGFKILWRQKKWSLFPMTDAVWAMFYYTQLYICAFSFQAHVERAAMRADEEYRILEEQHKASGSTADLPRPPLSLFPRGAAASPDARYIVQCNDAARALLRICVDSLFPGGALPYLPSRYLLWFTYAAIVLLKALYSGAMLRADHAETLHLIDRLCGCFAQTSNDEDNPAARYSRQIKALQQRLSSLATNTAPNSPTGGNQVSLPPMSARAEDPSLNHPNDSNSNANVNSNSSHFADAFPWLSSLDNSAINNPSNASPAWQLPVQTLPPNSISFPYPNTPSVAPPHQQPLSEVNNLHPLEFSTTNGNTAGMAGGGGNSLNLGFATLDDWFGSTSANLGEQADDVNNPFGGLDLQDFWMKVGPGEAQGGFPFR